MTFAGWCFLRFFEELSWVVLVALHRAVGRLVLGLARADEHDRDEARGGLLRALVHVSGPGLDGGAKLGLPDLLFFALFLGAAARWQLRAGWTWVCLTASIGGTMALATWLEVDGLPALPLLSVGFLLPNADLLWRAVRDRSARDPRRSPT